MNISNYYQMRRHLQEFASNKYYQFSDKAIFQYFVLLCVPPSDLPKSRAGNRTTGSSGHCTRPRVRCVATYEINTYMHVIYNRQLDLYYKAILGLLCRVPGYFNQDENLAGGKLGDKYFF